MLQCMASPGLGTKAVAQGTGVFASSEHAAGRLGSQITHLLLSSLLESVLSVLESAGHLIGTGLSHLMCCVP